MALNDFIPTLRNPNRYDVISNIPGSNISSDISYGVNIPTVPSIGANTTKASIADPTRGDNISSNLPDSPTSKPSAGNIISSVGGALTSLVDLGITLSSKDKVAPSPFANYATDTLNKINETEALAGKMKDLQLADVASAQNTQQAVNREEARGISSYRGLSLATYLGGIQQKRKVQENYFGNLEGLQMREANVMLNRDRVKMGEQDVINQRIQQEKDAYRTNVAQSVANVGTTMENIGRNLNVTKASEMAMRIAGNSGKYGTMMDYLDKLLG